MKQNLLFESFVREVRRIDNKRNHEESRFPSNQEAKSSAILFDLRCPGREENSGGFCSERSKLQVTSGRYVFILSSRLIANSLEVVLMVLITTHFASCLVGNLLYSWFLPY